MPHGYIVESAIGGIEVRQTTTGQYSLVDTNISMAKLITRDIADRLCHVPDDAYPHVCAGVLGDRLTADHMVPWFTARYVCSHCGTSWTDDWDCMCDDECPDCGTDMTAFDIPEHVELISVAEAASLTGQTVKEYLDGRNFVLRGENDN